MKTTVTKTVTETVTLCDHCGKEVIYAEQACIVCGKVACHDCFLTNLVELKLDSIPLFCPPLRCVETFRCYACPTCRNKVTRRFNAVKALTEKRNQQCKEWFRWYCEQIKTLNQWTGQ